MTFFKSLLYLSTAAYLFASPCLAKTLTTAERQKIRRKGEANAESRFREYSKKTGNYDDIFRIAASIDPKKPVGEFEAYVLTEAYFFSNISGCGWPRHPRDKGDRWVASTAVGIGGAAGPMIVVDKNTSLTYSPEWKVAPKVKDPKHYLKFIGRESKSSTGTLGKNVVECTIIDQKHLLDQGELEELKSALKPLIDRKAKVVTVRLSIETKTKISAAVGEDEGNLSGGGMNYEFIKENGSWHEHNTGRVSGCVN